jgi:hypothetical protein
MLAEVLDWTTVALGSPLLTDPTAAPGEKFSYKALFGDAHSLHSLRQMTLTLSTFMRHKESQISRTLQRRRKRKSLVSGTMETSG